MSNLEQTLSIIKPDAVERNLVEEIKNIFIKNNLIVKESKKIHITKDEAAEFYKVHQSKPFYNDLCAYLSSGPIFVMILEGNNADIWGSPVGDDIDNDGVIEFVISSKNKHCYIINEYGNIELDFEASHYLMATPSLANLDDDDDLEKIRSNIMKTLSKIEQAEVD